MSSTDNSIPKKVARRRRHSKNIAVLEETKSSSSAENEGIDFLKKLESDSEDPEEDEGITEKDFVGIETVNNEEVGDENEESEGADDERTSDEKEIDVLLDSYFTHDFEWESESEDENINNAKTKGKIRSKKANSPSVSGVNDERKILQRHANDSVMKEANKSSTSGEKRSMRKKGKKALKELSSRKTQKSDSSSGHVSDLDTSDEEDIRNTTGNIPSNWYDDYPHIGYDWEGKKIMKPDVGDQLDYFLKRMEDPNFWRTVRDTQTGQNVVLSDKDVDLIKRFESHKIPDESFDEYTPWIEWFTNEVMEMPLRKFPEHKRSFVPSKDEMRKVSKYVHALKMGWMKTRKELRKERKEKERRGPQFYMLWKTDDAAEEMRRIENYIRAPKRPLPGHSESYNPPAEYLFNEKEKKKWERNRKSLGNKKLHFVPQKYESLREVPAYKRYIRERFLRCLDLYMCPRAIKMKLTVEPEDLVPHLPSPKDLQPFPTIMSLVYKGHTNMVRSISVDPSGQFLVSGSDDLSIKFWEISTARCLKTVIIGGVARSVAWNPNQAVSLVAVAADRDVFLINPGLGDSVITSKTNTMLQDHPEEKEIPDRVKAVVKWEDAEGALFDQGVRVILHHFKEVKQVVWHAKGDYFSTVMPEGENRSVLIHRLSLRKSQLPFSKSRGLIQTVLFHPVRPFFFVATQRNIRVYDMIEQEISKKLYSNSQWISSMALHPGGDNLLVGTYDRKVLWFDLDLSSKPYKTLSFHSGAVRHVAIHKRYPLFASTSDDKSAIVSHGMVYNDLLQNALIVPLKRLSHHETFNDFSLFEAHFHPAQPWLFTCGADSTIRLYT